MGFDCFFLFLSRLFPNSHTELHLDLNFGSKRFFEVLEIETFFQCDMKISKLKTVIFSQKFSEVPDEMSSKILMALSADLKR